MTKSGLPRSAQGDGSSPAPGRHGMQPAPIAHVSHNVAVNLAARIVCTPADVVLEACLASSENTRRPRLFAIADIVLA